MSADLSQNTREYFAAAPPELIGERLTSRLQAAATFREGESENRQMMADAYLHYYGREAGYGVSTGVTRGGEQGELAQTRVNRARSLAKALLALITSNKVTWRPRARNGDAGAAAATALASNILEDFWKSRRFSQNYLWLVEQAIAFSKSYLFCPWDTSAGEPLAPDPSDPTQKRMLMTGDVRVRNVLPWDVFEDNALKSSADVQWRFLRVFENRFDVAASTSHVISGSSIYAGDQATNLILQSNDGNTMRELGGARLNYASHTELIAVWYFIHQPSAALPLGRLVKFLSPQVVLSDDALGYAPPGPVFRLAADEMFDTPHAWSPFWETLGAQEVNDNTETILASILTNMGNMCVGVEKGSDERPTKLASGFRAWLYNKGGKPPAPIQLATFPPDALKYKQMLAEDQAKLMGLNDVALGQPQTAQMNAQAFMVLASMATQQAAPFLSNCLDVLAKVGAHILKTLRKNVTQERELKVVGKANANLFALETYSGDSLSPIDGCGLDDGNPLEQTPAGRVQLLQMYQQIPGALTTLEQVQQVVDTGRPEAALRGARDAMLLVTAEFEALQRGENPPVHTTQNHPLHYRENSAVLASPEALKNPAVVQAVQQHLDQHYLEYFGVPAEQDPMRLARQRFLLGQGPEPMPPMMGPPPPSAPPGGPPHPNAGPAKRPGAPPPVGPSALQPPKQEGPIEPKTGAPFPPAGGGNIPPALQ